MNQSECWQLGSGRWMRDLKSETWRLETTPNGARVHASLPAPDVARLTGAMHDASEDDWFPPEFSYSPRTGARLQGTVAPFGSAWVPPYGAAPVSDLGEPLSNGLWQTPNPLIVRSSGLDGMQATADRSLPPLPPGRFHFLVHRFDVASPILMAIDARHGRLLVLLPESRRWVALEHPAGGLLTGAGHERGWRMEVVEGSVDATLYLPTVRGLAAVTPTLVGLSYRVAYLNEGQALGGPVAWTDRIWAPALGADGRVKLVGKPKGLDKALELQTGAPAPAHGFESPVFDSRRVIWLSEEGHLVLRLDSRAGMQAEWIGWPEGLRPRFAAGCPHRAASGEFWQLCSGSTEEAYEYVQLGHAAGSAGDHAWPGTVPVDHPRLTTGGVSYLGRQRIDGEPWSQPQHEEAGTSPEVVVPLIESASRRAVIGLRIAAPQGALALLETDRERHLAVLQLEADSSPGVLALGAFTAARPWTATLFVHDEHLWMHHPELSQAMGWKLEN
jgi:hypothetical protein